MNGVLIAITSGKSGRELEYEAWYSEFHVPEIMDIPAITSARRFRLAADRDGPRDRFVSVVVYECTDVEAARAQLDAGRDRRTPSDSHDPDITRLWFCEEIRTYEKPAV